MNGMLIPRVFILTTIASAAAFHAAPVWSHGDEFVGGEIGYVVAAPSGAMTSEQVRRELDQFLRHPVTADGYRSIGGEIGFVREVSATATLGSGTGRALTREQVRQDFLAFQRHPLSADGAWRYVGGERGWIPASAGR